MSACFSVYYLNNMLLSLVLQLLKHMDSAKVLLSIFIQIPQCADKSVVAVDIL